MTAELPEGWARLSIEEAATKCTSGYWGDDAPRDETLRCRVIRNGDVRKDTAIERNLPYRHFRPREVKKARVMVDDVILVTSGAYTGTVARIREADVFDPTVASNFVRLIRGDGKTDGEFLGHLLASPIAQAGFVGFIGGSAIPNLQSAAYRLMKLPFPPLPEQRRIAAILSSVDDVIAATRRVIEQAKRVKQGLLHTVVNRGIGHTRFKRTEVGEIPESWQVQSIGDVSLVKGGKRMPKGRPFADHTTAYPYIRVSDFADGTVRDDELEYVLPEDQKEIARYTIGADDVYISIAGTIGLVGQVPKHLHGAQLTENAARISVRTDRVDPAWVVAALDSPVGQGQIEYQKGVGGGVPKLALFRIKQLRIPVPPIEEQEEILKILSAWTLASRVQMHEWEQTEILKRGLMQDLLTGRVRVQPD